MKRDAAARELSTPKLGIPTNENYVAKERVAARKSCVSKPNVVAMEFGAVKRDGFARELRRIKASAAAQEFGTFETRVFAKDRSYEQNIGKLHTAKIDVAWKDNTRQITRLGLFSCPFDQRMDRRIEVLNLVRRPEADTFSYMLLGIKREMKDAPSLPTEFIFAVKVAQNFTDFIGQVPELTTLAPSTFVF